MPDKVPKTENISAKTLAARADVIQGMSRTDTFCSILEKEFAKFRRRDFNINRQSFE